MVTTKKNLDILQITNLINLASFFKISRPWRSFCKTSHFFSQNQKIELNENISNTQSVVISIKYFLLPSWFMFILCFYDRMFFLDNFLFVSKFAYLLHYVVINFLAHLLVFNCFSSFSLFLSTLNILFVAFIS